MNTHEWITVLSFWLAIQPMPMHAVTNESTFFDRGEEGYFWYQDPEPEIEEEVRKEQTETKKQSSVPATAIPPNLLTPDGRDPLEVLEEYQKNVERAKALAVLYPTRETVQQYQYLNMAALNQASLFSDVWRRNVWQNPALDYQMKRPVTFVARTTYTEERDDKIRKAIQEAAGENGFFFFFRSTCPYCHKFAPMLKQLEKEYGVKVLPISLDGKGLPDYPNPKHDVVVARKLGVTSVPTLFIVNPREKTQMLVTNRLISMNELKERIYVLTQTKPGEDY